MNIKKPTARLAGALVLGAASLAWAGPSPELMNAVSAIRLEAAKPGQSKTVSPGSNDEFASRSAAFQTHTITAGQSTVAVPVTALGRATQLKDQKSEAVN